MHFAGGEPGARGVNFLLRSEGKTIYLGPKTAVDVLPGVRLYSFVFLSGIEYSYNIIFTFCFRMYSVWKLPVAEVSVHLPMKM